MAELAPWCALRQRELRVQRAGTLETVV
jgi:hypothetical protein